MFSFASIATVLWTPSCSGALGAALWPSVTAATSDLIKISFVCQCCLWFWGFGIQWGPQVLPHSPPCLGPVPQEGAGAKDKSPTCPLCRGRGCKQAGAGVIRAPHLGAAPAHLTSPTPGVEGWVGVCLAVGPSLPSPGTTTAPLPPPCALGCSFLPGSRPGPGPHVSGPGLSQEARWG